jgi:DNA-binding GntR family transcriptional regulator
MSQPPATRSRANVSSAPPRAPAGSLAAQVTQRLRLAIQDAEFPLGEALSELKLAAWLGVSRTPVREALNALQLEGLIDIRPQSGSFVFAPSEESVGELSEFRRIIERAALRLCLARRKEETLRQMRAASDAMEQAEAAGDVLAASRADTAFHQCIAENSANAYLIQAYGLISGRVAALRTHNNLGAATLRVKGMREHRAVIAAFAKGDLEAAETVLDEHVARMRAGFQAARRSRSQLK